MAGWLHPGPLCLAVKCQGNASFSAELLLMPKTKAVGRSLVAFTLQYKL